MKRIFFIVTALFLSLFLSCSSPKYTITYISDGAIISEVTVEEGSKLDKPNDPIKEGYTFNGWHYKDEEWKFVGYVVTSDMTLEAQWLINEFKVSFITNCEYEISDQIIKYGEKICVENPVKEGHTFVGWFTDENFNSSYDLEKPVNTDLTLYAKFTINEYKIEFENVEYEDIFVEHNDSLSNLESPTKDGYKFNGWFTDENFDNSYDLEAPVNTDLTLYAKFTINEYKIEFENVEYEDIFVEHNNNLSYLESPTKEGYLFKGWFTDSIFSTAYDINLPIHSDLVLYAKWKYDRENEDGYISLENENANGAIDANDYYEVYGQKIKTKNVYKTYYRTEINREKLNYLCNSWTFNSEVYCNMVDGLVENDKYSNVVGAIAVAYKTKLNDNGTQTWTFILREDAKWVDNKTGEVVANVVAQDFVDGIKYVLDPLNGSSTAYIVTSLINGSAEYYDAMFEDLKNEELTDEQKEELWKAVGVKAVSDYELEYTLYQATPYFLSRLTYSPFLPVNGEYLEEQGSEFGTTVNNILVNGAFRVTEHVFQSKIVYTKNDKYYDKEHVYVDTVENTFYSADVATEAKLREWFEAGYIDSFSVNKYDAEGMKKYVYGENNEGSIKNPVSELCNPVLSFDNATYIGYYNFARETYEYTNPDLTKTDAEKAATLAAIQNKNFRKGVLYGLEVMKYLEYYNSENPQEWLMRGYTNRELTVWDGLDYADYVDAVFNEKQGTNGVSLTGIKNGSDPVYNPTKAAQFFATAKAELIAAGLTEADFPIKVDVIGSMSERQVGYEEAMYASLEAAGTGVIDIQINYPTSHDQNTQWSYIFNNYDFSMWSGWSPDYADPQTFLQTMVVRGYIVDQLGFTAKDDANIALEKSVLGAYTELFDKAAAIVDVAQTDERYKAFAEAEYALIYEEAIIVPWLTQNEYVASVAKTIPYQTGRASYGLTQYKFKNVVVSNETITKELHSKILLEYELEKYN